MSKPKSDLPTSSQHLIRIADTIRAVIKNTDEEYPDIDLLTVETILTNRISAEVAKLDSELATLRTEALLDMITDSLSDSAAKEFAECFEDIRIR